jgi:hypothetical protein
VLVLDSDCKQGGDWLALAVSRFPIFNVRLAAAREQWIFTAKRTAD